MRLNNKGFAVSIILYSTITIIIMVLVLILSVYTSSVRNKITLGNTIKDKISDNDIVELDSQQLSIKINPSIPDSITKGDNYSLLTTGSYTTGTINSTITCTIDNVEVNYQNINTSSLDVGEHNISCTIRNDRGKSVTDSRKITVTNSQYTITNIVTNGSFENGVSSWNVDKVSSFNSRCFDGTKCVVFSYNQEGYASDREYEDVLSQVTSVKPIVGHRYYGSLMFKTFEGHSYGAADVSRFEWSYNDKVSGRLLFGKLNTKTDGWSTVSYIQSIDSNTYTLADEEWKIKINLKRPTNSAYVDAVMLIDLTAAFGEGNEPTKLWCDQHIRFFNGSTTINK